MKHNIQVNLLSFSNRNIVRFPDADRQPWHLQIRARLSPPRPAIGLILTGNISTTAKQPFSQVHCCSDKR